MARPVKYYDNKYEMALAVGLTERRRELLHSTGDDRYRACRVAERCHVSPPAFSHWESTRYAPLTFAGWKRWADALGTRLVIELATGRV